MVDLARACIVLGDDTPSAPGRADSSGCPFGFSGEGPDSSVLGRAGQANSQSLLTIEKKEVAMNRMWTFKRSRSRSYCQSLRIGMALLAIMASPFIAFAQGGT